MHPKIFSTKKLAAFSSKTPWGRWSWKSSRYGSGNCGGSFVVGENWKLSQSHDSQWFFMALLEWWMGPRFCWFKISRRLDWIIAPPPRLGCFGKDLSVGGRVSFLTCVGERDWTYPNKYSPTQFTWEDGYLIFIDLLTFSQVGWSVFWRPLEFIHAPFFMRGVWRVEENKGVRIIFRQGDLSTLSSS